MNSVECVGDIIKEYPFLARAIYVSDVYYLFIVHTCSYKWHIHVTFLQVSYEFDLIMKDDKLENSFMESWKRCSFGVVRYAQASKTESKELRSSLRDDDTEGK